MTGAYVVLDHLTITNHYTTGQGLGISKSANHVTVSNRDLYGAPQQNMILDGHDCLIYKNRIHDSGRAGYYGRYSHGLYVEGPNNTIRSNLIYNNQTNGVQLYNGYGTLVGGNVLEYNYIFHNGWVAQATPSTHSYAGIIVSDGHPNTTIRDNRLCGNAQYGILVQHYDGAALSGTSITDNVTCYNGYGGIWLDEGASETVLRNISYYDKPYAISTISGVASDYDTDLCRRHRAAPWMERQEPLAGGGVSQRLGPGGSRPGRRPAAQEGRQRLRCRPARSDTTSAPRSTRRSVTRRRG